MRDPARIRRILAKLQNAWGICPDLRLGQLIVNCMPSDNKTNLFYIEDDDLETNIENFIDKMVDEMMKRKSF